MRVELLRDENLIKIGGDIRVSQSTSLNETDTIGSSVKFIIRLCQNIQELTSSSIGLTLLGNMLLVMESQLNTVLIHTKVVKETRKARINQFRFGQFFLFQVPPKSFIHRNIVVFISLNISHTLLF